MSDDCVPLELATLTQILDELTDRFPHMVVGILRGDVNGTSDRRMAVCRRGSVVIQIGLARALCREAEDELSKLDSEELDEGN